MKHNLWILLIAALLFIACGDDDTHETPEAKDMTLTLVLQMPEGIADGRFSNISLTARDVNYGRETTQALTLDADLAARVTLPQGFYILTLKATLDYTHNGQPKQVEVQGYKESVQLTSEAVSLSLPLYLTTTPQPDDPSWDYSGFVLAEIFCAGSATPQGTYYYADKYFVIYNNTDRVLYADSVCIVESEFMTVDKNDYHPDIMNEAIAVDAVYMIPGSGHDVPVEPGDRLVLVDNALNHLYANPNSWDMTRADYEWYDESTNPQYTDVDYPDVPNLERFYSKTLTMWSPHTQGFKSYALVHMNTTKTDYLSNYMYDYECHIVGATGEADLAGTCYKIPNSWVIDAVNMSVPSMFQWIVTTPQLDHGYTYSAEYGWDETRFNKSVRRKVASREGDRAILQDTNNSTDDFEPRVEADPWHQF